MIRKKVEKIHFNSRNEKLRSDNERETKIRKLMSNITEIKHHLSTIICGRINFDENLKPKTSVKNT